MSHSSWGIHLEELLTVGEWTSHESSMHINSLEMWVVLLALSAFQDGIMNHSLVLITSDTSIVASLNKQGGGH